MQTSYKYCKNRMDAEDLAGETILKILSNKHSYDESKPFKPWCSVIMLNTYITSSKSTIIHYQCVSTGCCVHVARIKISIDNQHVTKPMQRYDILPEQPKEKT